MTSVSIPAPVHVLQGVKNKPRAFSKRVLFENGLFADNVGSWG
jgi:hypothetical protein